jgi:nucleotide-binding universal stress UspA family protein
MVNQNPHVDPLPLPAVGAGTAVVLVGIDGSETSWHALSWACGEARRLRGRAVAVFVSSSADNGIPASAFAGAAPFDCSWNDSMAAERTDTLRRELERYAAGLNVDLTFVHTHGNAASELLRLATEFAPSSMMRSPRPTPRSRSSMDTAATAVSRSTKLIRRSPCTR